MTRSKLFLLRCRFWFLAPFSLRGLTWATLSTRTQTNLKMAWPSPSTHILKLKLPCISMFVTCKLSVKVLKIRSNPVNFFWLVIRSDSGQNDPNPVRFRQNFRSGRTLVKLQLRAQGRGPSSKYMFLICFVSQEVEQDAKIASKNIISGVSYVFFKSGSQYNYYTRAIQTSNCCISKRLWKHFLRKPCM